MSTFPSPPEPGIDRYEGPDLDPAAEPSCLDFPAELAAFERNAEPGRWHGPRYRMSYHVLGDGPPLIMIQGLASTYRGYAPVLNRLAKRFRTVICDYPGEKVDDGASLSQIHHEHLVDDLFGLVDHLGIDRAYLFGASFGSTILLSALLRDPERWFPRAVIQGGFARRPLTFSERSPCASVACCPEPWRASRSGSPCWPGTTSIASPMTWLTAAGQSSPRRTA